MQAFCLVSQQSKTHREQPSYKAIGQAFCFAKNLAIGWPGKRDIDETVVSLHRSSSMPRSCGCPWLPTLAYKFSICKISQLTTIPKSTVADFIQRAKDRIAQGLSATGNYLIHAQVDPQNYLRRYLRSQVLSVLNVKAPRTYIERVLHNSD